VHAQVRRNSRHPPYSIAWSSRAIDGRQQCRITDEKHCGHPRKAGQAPDFNFQKGEKMETVEIESRSDFAAWAIQRAQEIVAVEGTALAVAARDMDEDALAKCGAALGQAITDAMLEVFDGLLSG
jgi:hypothetical protein